MSTDNQQILAEFHSDTVHQTLMSNLGLFLIDGSCPFELFVREMVKIDNPSIYKVDSLVIRNGHTAAIISTSKGSYTLQVRDMTSGDQVSVSIMDTATYATVNTFTLSKQQPSGIPEGG